MARLSKFAFLFQLLLVLLTPRLADAMTPDDSCDVTGGRMEFSKPSDLPDDTTFWGYYKCSNCVTETSSKPIDGVQTCDNCGSPHTNEAFYATKKGTEAVAEDQLATSENIDEALSGEKRVCPYCKSTQFDNEKNCLQCGGGADGLAFDQRYDSAGLERFERDQVAKNPRLKKKSKVVMWASGAVILVASTIGLSWGLQLRGK